MRVSWLRLCSDLWCESGTAAVCSDSPAVCTVGGWGVLFFYFLLFVVRISFRSACMDLVRLDS